MGKGPYGGPPGEFLFLLFDGVLPVILLVGVLAYLAVRVSRGVSSPGGERGPARTGAALIEALSVLAVGVLIALFVGFGIEAFYPSPTFPEPERFEAEEEFVMEEGPNGEIEKGLSPEAVKSKADFEREYDVCEEEISGYSRIASPVAVGIAVLILAAVLFLKRTGVPAIRDGTALGGVLTLFYGLGLALQAEGGVFRFLMVTAALLVVLAAVYLRFKPEGRDDSTESGG